MLTVPAFCVLVYTTIHPVVSTVWMGVTYSLAAVRTFVSIPLFKYILRQILKRFIKRFIHKLMHDLHTTITVYFFKF